MGAAIVLIIAVAVLALRQWLFEIGRKYLTGMSMRRRAKIGGVFVTI